MIALINGYICRNSYEAAEALRGKDPDAPLGAPPYSTGDAHKVPAAVNPPAPPVDSALNVLLGSFALPTVPPNASNGNSGGDAAANVKAAPAFNTGAGTATSGVNIRV